MRELYVYYKVPISLADQIRPQVLNLHQQLLEHHPGLCIRWLQRAHESVDGLVTWMEIYTHSEGVDPALAREIEIAAQACPAFQTIGARHVEVFEQHATPLA